MFTGAQCPKINCASLGTGTHRIQSLSRTPYTCDRLCMHSLTFQLSCLWYRSKGSQDEQADSTRYTNITSITLGMEKPVDQLWRCNMTSSCGATRIARHDSTPLQQHLPWAHLGSTEPHSQCSGLTGPGPACRAHETICPPALPRSTCADLR